jgi:RNA polymerase sigma factor (sigma-70 family)
MHVENVIETAMLAERFRRGDEKSVAQVLSDLCPPIQRRLTHKFRSCIHRDEVEHIVLAALERAWENHAHYDRAKGPLGAWLWTIANHLASDFARSPYIRSRRVEVAVHPGRLAELVQYPSRGDDDDSASFADSQSCDLVRHALASLPGRLRVVMLADANSPEGLVPTRELARDLGIAQATVRTYRRRGLQKLGRILRSLGVDKLVGALRPKRTTN